MKKIQSKDELKAGMLIWWEADRMFHSWSVPGIITEVNGDGFKVITFDDFKECGPLRIKKFSSESDDATWEEMRICSINEIEEYCLKQEYTLVSSIKLKEYQIEKMRKDLENARDRFEKVKELIEKLSKIEQGA